VTVTDIVTGLTSQDISSGKFSAPVSKVWRQIVAAALNIPLSLVGNPTVKAGINGYSTVTTDCGPAATNVLTNKISLDQFSTDPTVLSAGRFTHGVFER
jgi:hypothetical protein